MKRIAFETYLSRALLAATSLIILLLLLPVSVVTDWKLTTDKGSYSVGDQIMLTSEYNKHYNLKANSNRSLNCDAPNGSVTYPILFSYAGKGIGKHTTISKIVIPEIDNRQPVKCRVNIDLIYVVAGVKPVKQSNISNDFWINGEK